jgi:hypothetical protein
MLNKTARAALLFLPLMLSFPGPSYAEKTPLQEATMNAAIAATCRAQMGDDELFEVAFEEMRQAAINAGEEARLGELDAWREKMLSMPSDPNPIAPALCAPLRAHLIPE